MNLLAYSDANNQLAAFREGPWKLHIRISSEVESAPATQGRNHCD